MPTYNTKIKYGTTTEDFHPLTITVEPMPGVTVFPSGTLEFVPVNAGPIKEGKITFSDGGKRFRGFIRTDSNGPVDYWGAVSGQPLDE